MDRVEVEILDRVAAIDDELPVALDDAHDRACRLTAPDALPVLHLLAIHIHVPVSVSVAAIAPLDARRRRLARLSVKRRVQRELQIFHDGHLLVHRPGVGMVLGTGDHRLYALLLEFLVPLDSLLPWVDIVYGAAHFVLPLHDRLDPLRRGALHNSCAATTAPCDAQRCAAAAPAHTERDNRSRHANKCTSRCASSVVIVTALSLRSAGDQSGLLPSCTRNARRGIDERPNNEIPRPSAVLNRRHESWR
mmetsp:Transcript_33366/g.92108  ORF Transcript_33366/g.92108 Transcript_33366/m.92108 type:complete len:249 (-) Transcript_33366:115-861(-)